MNFSSIRFKSLFKNQIGHSSWLKKNIYIVIKISQDQKRNFFLRYEPKTHWPHQHDKF